MRNISFGLSILSNVSVVIGMLVLSLAVVTVIVIIIAMKYKRKNENGSASYRWAFAEVGTTDDLVEDKNNG